MNVKRGLFRLWLVVSAMFAVAVISLSYSKVQKEMAASIAIANISPTDVIEIPVLCGRTRGTRNTDYYVQPGQDGSSDDHTCWYDMDKFRELFVEYKGLSDLELSRRTYAEAGRPISFPRPWVTVSYVVGVAFGFPLAVLAIGGAFVWAFAGFTRPKPEA
jgi:hypothetical protein